MKRLKSTSIERGSKSDIFTFFLVLERVVIIPSLILVLLGILKPPFIKVDQIFLTERKYIQLLFIQIDASWIPFNTWITFWSRPVQILAQPMAVLSLEIAGVFLAIIFYQFFTRIRSGLPLYGSTPGEEALVYSKGVKIDLKHQNPENTWFPHKIKIYLLLFTIFTVQGLMLAFMTTW